MLGMKNTHRISSLEAAYSIHIDLIQQKKKDIYKIGQCHYTGIASQCNYAALLRHRHFGNFPSFFCLMHLELRLARFTSNNSFYPPSVQNL